MTTAPIVPTLESLEFEGRRYKIAYAWVIPMHPSTTGFPGITSDLFFSSPEAFARIHGDLPEPAASHFLVPTWVPEDFSDWDYIPENY